MYSTPYLHDLHDSRSLVLTVALICNCEGVVDNCITTLDLCTPVLFCPNKFLSRIIYRVSITLSIDFRFKPIENNKQKKNIQTTTNTM